jgi:hypothetical protein
MNDGVKSTGLSLTEEEAFSLLELCLTSSTKLNITSETALRKLATYCSDRNYNLRSKKIPVACERT